MAGTAVRDPLDCGRPVRGRVGCRRVRADGVVLGEVAEGDGPGHQHARGDEHRPALEQEPGASGGAQLRQARGTRRGAFGGARGPDDRRSRRQGRRGRAQRHAGAVHELADGTVGEAQVVRDLGAAVSSHRRTQQRLALVPRERRHPGQGLAHHRAALEVRLRPAQ